MTEDILHLTTDDKHNIAIHHWPATTQARGSLVWMHGMSEHGARYADMAATLNAQGWHVFCPDHRGHGASIQPHCPEGHFADDNGWRKVIRDAISVLTFAKDMHSTLPLVLGGHSMGSFIALAAAEHYDGQLAGLVQCGSNYQHSLFYLGMQLPLRLARLVNGKRGTSHMIHNLTFGAWAKQVKNPRTEYDWISGDAEQVQQYINDPLCGFPCTTETWVQLAKGLRHIHSVDGLANLPEDLPVLILAGQSDPMSDMGKGTAALEAAFEGMGQPLTAHFWETGRHEIHNDLCRPEVYGALSAWLQERLN